MISEEDPFKFASENDVKTVVNTYLTNVNRFYMNLEANTNPPNSANVIGQTYISDLADLRVTVQQFFKATPDCFECHKLMSKINHMIFDLRRLLNKKFGTDPGAIGGKRKYKSRRHRKTSHRRKTNRRRRKTNRRRK
jgi:hypothetical protein